MKTRVLLVNDNWHSCQSTEINIRHKFKGISIITCDNARDAIALIRADLPFELVITNFNSVIIAAQAKHSETKTIAVSGTLIKGEKMKGCTPDITLAVPFTNEELTEAVGYCLDGKLP